VKDAAHDGMPRSVIMIDAADSCTSAPGSGADANSPRIGILRRQQ